MNEEKICITVQEMAKRLSIGQTTAYKLANHPNFYPAKRIGGKIVINLNLLDKWFNEK